MTTQAEVIEVEEPSQNLPALIEPQVMDITSLRKAVDFEAERITVMQKFVASKMHDGTHFGTIPGSKKPSLWKPGAEVMCGIYRYGARYKIHVTEDYAATKHYSIERYNKTVEGDCRGFYEVRVSCTLYHTASGTEVGEGVGSCNNWEKKYVTSDLFDLKNTVLKMAKKRAYVDATLSACRLSDFFTQDIEDFAEGPSGTPTPAPAPRKPSPPKDVLYQGKVKAIETSSGKKKNGQPWTLWTVIMEDGERFGTFSESMAKIARDFQESGDSLGITWETTAKGNKNIVEIIPF